MEGALGLLDHHLVTSADEDGDSLGCGAVLDDDHPVLGGAEGDFLDGTRRAELVRAELLEPRDDAAAGGDGDELELDAADPANGGELLVHQKVVGFVVEAPLADDEGGARVLALLNHVLEVLLLLQAELLVLLRGVDVDLVLRLGLRGLEGAGEDGDLGILDLLRHLRVRDVLVEDDAVDQHGVLELAANLPFNLDEVEVHVPALKVRHGHHSLDADLGHLALAPVDNLGRQRGHARLH